MTVEFPPSAVQRPSGPSASAPSSPGTVTLQPGPGAKQRVLVTADRLFYDEGIRTVGVDRLIAESAVTKATFYKHFGAKDNLVLEYIGRRRDDAMTAVDEIATASDDALSTLRGIRDAIALRLQEPGFRGCPFVNAGAEFAEADHPVRQVVLDHREWYTERLVDLFREAGHPMPGDGADEFYLARDGAMVGGYEGDPIAATSAFVRITDRLFADCAA